MNVLLVLRGKPYVPSYLATIVELAARGHVVRVAWPEHEKEGTHQDLEGLDGVSWETFNPWRTDSRREGARLSRFFKNYIHYLKPPYRDARKVRARMFNLLMLEAIGEGVADWGEPIGLGLPQSEVERLLQACDLVESRIPSDPSHEAIILRDARPDIVLFAPVVEIAPLQADLIKSARALGIPSVMLLFSWDNLSTKGTLHVPPDWMLTWNERQKQEAVELHGYPAEQIGVVGAGRFDGFYEGQPASSYEEFCGIVGLDPARPCVTYVCSSALLGSEWAFVEKWVAAIRTSPDEALREANILVRAHPDIVFDGISDETMRRKRNDRHGLTRSGRPFTDQKAVLTYGKNARFYYDTLYHSAVVVGLNTTAEIEAAMLGRPVLTVLTDEDEIDGQASTLHFHYILEENGGFVRAARSLPEHLTHLSAALRSERAQPSDAVKAFVRPWGWETPAGVVVADMVEGLAAGRGRLALTRSST